MTTAQAPEKFAPDGRLRSINPLTFDVLETFDVTAPAALPDIFSRARAAQQLWAELPAKERAARLTPLLARIVERGDALAELIHSEQGKSITEATFSEILGAAEVVRVHLKRDPQWLAAQKVPLDPLSYPGKKARVEHRPRGVVVAIMPWNYPLALPMRTLVPALLCGNAVLLKPSEHSPTVGRAIGELFAGLIPDGLLQILQGGGELGAALSSDPQTDAIVFTGSVRTGKAVARAAAANLTPLSLELGGKDAAIVCRDADLKRSARGIAWGAFHNSGQNCAAIERVYVEADIYEDFLAELKDATASLRTEGDPDTIEVGPICTAAQFGVVSAQLEQAVARGARVVTGGRATGRGWGIEPTVLADVPQDCDVWTEETFGPLLPVRKVHSVYEAVDLSNASPFGLSVSVWGKNAGRAEEVALRCEVGMALVNNHSFNGSLPESPWVGTKASGSGVTGSALALKFLTRPQVVLVDRSKQLEVWWFPLNNTALALGRTLLASLVAPALKRISLTLRLLGLLGKRWKD